MPSDTRSDFMTDIGVKAESSNSESCCKQHPEHKSNSNSNSNSNRVTHHIVILKHGITGNHKELEYVKKSLENEYGSSAGTGTTNSNSTLHVHLATCNDNNSLDGIEPGGHRFAKEINDVVRSVATDIVREREREQESASENDTKGENQNHSIALSILGNSMGGLYARFALRFIDWTVQIDGESSTSPCIIELQVVPHVFVTIATPNLGMKDLTYFNIPKFLEPLTTVFLGQSGNDMMRRDTSKKRKSPMIFLKYSDVEVDAGNGTDSDSDESDRSEYVDIIAELCLNPEYIRPLSRFSRRIAYANAFSTDIAVTTATGAFLFDDDTDTDTDTDSTPREDSYPTSSSPHVFVPGIDDEEQEVGEDNAYGYSCVRFDTKKTYVYENNTDDDSTLVTSSGSPTIAGMARSLDSLGWSKVFIDARPHTPALFKRPERQRRQQASFAEFLGSSSSDDEEDDDNGATATATRVVEKSWYSSGELKSCLSGNGFDGNTLPFAHCLLVANTKSRIHKKLFKSGRPFVDQVLAKDVMRDVLHASQ